MYFIFFPIEISRVLPSMILLRVISLKMMMCIFDLQKMVYCNIFAILLQYMCTYFAYLNLIFFFTFIYGAL